MLPRALTPSSDSEGSHCRNIPRSEKPPRPFTPSNRYSNTSSHGSFSLAEEKNFCQQHNSPRLANNACFFARDLTIIPLFVVSHASQIIPRKLLPFCVFSTLLIFGIKSVFDIFNLHASIWPQRVPQSSTKPSQNSLFDAV